MQVCRTGPAAVFWVQPTGAAQRAAAAVPAAAWRAAAVSAPPASPARQALPCGAAGCPAHQPLPCRPSQPTVPICAFAIREPACCHCKPCVHAHVCSCPQVLLSAHEYKRPVPCVLHAHCRNLEALPLRRVPITPTLLFLSPVLFSKNERPLPCLLTQKVPGPLAPPLGLPPPPPLYSTPPVY